MNEYTITIGLEIHAELKTQSKMFCGCANSPEDRTPNAYICPVCMGHPGTLPTINKQAVKHVLTVGATVGGTLADFTEFDRKNYFYPDIPKGYQISQYKFPLVSGGTLAGVALTRVHLEEDTARSSHDTPGVSLVDFNRAGVPLMELVTEPVIHSAQEAMDFAKELQLLLKSLNVSDANMERGEMRVEVNISISKTETFGTKVEVKNINSFRAAGKAIEFEYARQREILEKGKKVVQETRGWDENRSLTFSQRSKEDAHDYRYFPDPDLPKLLISEIPEFSLPALRSEMGELPSEKRTRYAREFGVKAEDIETYVTQPLIGAFFESVVSCADFGSSGIKEGIQTASNYITSDLIGLSKTRKQSDKESDSLENDTDFSAGLLTPQSFASLILLVRAGELSSRGAKDTLKVLFETGGDAKSVAEEKGFIQKNDPEELKNLISKIILDNPDVVSEYKSGKESVLQFLIGQGMKMSKGRANPELLKSIILEIIKA